MPRENAGISELSVNQLFCRCRRKKTIVEEGLCHVERGNSSNIHESIEGFIYPINGMSHKDETVDESSSE